MKRAAVDMMPSEHDQGSVATPPPIKRGGVVGREREPLEPVGEEPSTGMEVGITTIHPLQHWVPIAFKTDGTYPWSKPPLFMSVDDPTPTFLLLMLDLSPSMACGHDTCAAAAIVSLLESLPAYLAKTLSQAQMQTTVLGIAAFSGTAGWLNQDHTPHQRVFGNRETGNWVSGARLDTIEAQTVPVKDAAALLSYLGEWVDKVKRMFIVDDDGTMAERGAGTNIEAALYFAHNVIKSFTSSRHGGTGQVFLCTDGVATCGDVRSAVIRETLDEVLFDHDDATALPIQVHALMMGSSPKPHSLTSIIGSRGLLGYAKDPASIASGLDTILKPAFANAKGSMDFVMFVAFYNVDTNERVSELQMTTYSQGQFGVGDNTTALFGALVPDKFRSVGACCPTEEDASKLLVRVTGFCYPNLLSEVHEIRSTLDCVNEEVQKKLLSRGHEILLDTRIPVVTNRWWAPKNLRGPHGDYMSMPKIDLLYSTTAREASSTSLHRWVEQLQLLLQGAQEALSRSSSSRDAADTSKRYSEMASCSGHASLARRLDIVRLSSERNAVLEEEGDASDFGSSAHVATSALSQAE